MPNLTLFKRGIKSTWKTWLIFVAILSMYGGIIVTMFNPEIGEALIAFEKAMPELMAMVGMKVKDSSLIGFISSYLYGFIMIIFPMLFSIIVAISLIANPVDQGSMAYLLSAPVKRSSAIITQILVLLTGLTLLLAYFTLLIISVSAGYFPGELDIPKFLWLNLGAYALHLFIASIVVFSATLFNDKKYALGFGVGIPLLAYIIQMLANAGDKYEYAKYFTFLTLFAPDKITAGENFGYIGMIILGLAAIIIFVLTVEVFKRKDLHI